MTDWCKRWDNADTPWDKGQASPALVDLLTNHADLVPSKGQGLVPGCGSGYDVVLLATDELHITGLDMSSTCVRLCNEKLGSSSNGKYDFLCDDFYKFKIPEGGYDIVFDYTFLCAMPPHMRPDWASRMAEIIKPGGTLVALIYPLKEKPLQPPFTVSVELYFELLSEHFDNVYLEEAKGHGSRLGEEKMSVWKRKT
ncbi:S-adenosyl-L-methionine-dependent methyltransferase [Zychaea mexicana]|uniref:S-adenosyl-L-methionine-dependent methyltransferase n=1 Tax=Zychaea mexicana TaxID=64656 RepID=UPI0022FE60CB|nr:S-adenosyl-L-methionine-dependent methyltransferase [Zychaea mexicana]KAI9479533.1 S-adenosyl-L-methionine-dependent methyltransferase [Zychaea mexicana]